MRWYKILFKLSLILLFIFISFIVYIKILEPSYYSYLNACNPDKLSKLQEENPNIIKTGETNVSYDEETNEKTI